MGASIGEFFMRREAALIDGIISACGVKDSRIPFSSSLRNRVPAVARIAVICLLCFSGLRPLWAGTNEVAGGLIVQRSMRAAPHRLLVHPNGATIAANQTQRFGVTDAQGKPVAVRWNVSGIGCSGSACGTIDNDGVYQPPATLPQPRIVTLEGVLISNPNYSVLAEVRLQDVVSTTPVAVPTQVASAGTQTQILAAPVIPKQPVIGKQKVARSAEFPMPNAIGAAPMIDRRPVIRSEALPMPGVVAAAPEVGGRDVTRSAPLPPLPGVIAAAPDAGSRTITRSGELPLPRVVGAAPEVGASAAAASKRTRSVEMLPLPNAVAASPDAGSRKVPRGGDLPLPRVVAAAPQVSGRNSTRTIELLPLPRAVASAPTVGDSSYVSAAKSRPPDLVAGLSPAPARVSASQPQLASPLRERNNAGAADRQLEVKNPARSALLPPMQDVAGAAAMGAASASRSGAPVTYADGQLTINAENITMAAVLKLVAEKTGAVIEVPPGTGQERIFEHAGPGRAENVLAALLNGSSFDFVIVGSPQRQEGPTQVLLSLHQAEDKTASLPAPPPKVAAPATLWTPPPATDTAAVVLPAGLDPATIEPPKEPMSPEALGQMMKEKARALREQIQQQQQ